jgi:DNA helicase-2/ATP-dependent DNA helicase PcrA
MSLINVNKLWPAYLTSAEELRDNPEQWKVYESRGSIVVLAGPGSGKTKVLTIKTARILNEDIRPPRGVACITYNSECARELKRRLEQLGVEESSNVFIGTIHSFCLKNVLIPLGEKAGANIPYPFEVAAPSIQSKLLARALEATGINDPVSRWKTRVDKYRRTFLDRESAAWKETDVEVAEIIDRY